MPTFHWWDAPTLFCVLSPSVPVRSSHGTGLVLVALVLGLVLGATAVGMVWFVSGRTASATELPNTTASSDAAAACAILAGLPQLSFADQSPQGQYRLTGAASLAQAAQAEDSHYTALSMALSRVNQVLVRRVATGTQLTVALDSARAACADL
jgi:pyruvate/2-oxoacid:ferredoxin oxidoreductase alpha subunit